jgi:hypothetical protein
VVQGWRVVWRVLGRQLQLKGLGLLLLRLVFLLPTLLYLLLILLLLLSQLKTLRWPPRFPLWVKALLL